MATVQGPARKGSVEKKTLLQKLDRLFKISPVKTKAKDGSNEPVTVEHRIGREAGYFSSESLMQKLGLEAEFSEYSIDMQRKIRDHDRLKEVLEDKYRVQKSKMTHAVSDYRKYLERFYGAYPRPLLPMFAFVPVGERQDGIYIQGLLDEATYKLVVGEPGDSVLWCETVFTKTKKWADLNARAQQTAHALTSMPGLNKDLRHRIQHIAHGKLPERLNYNGGAETKKE